MAESVGLLAALRTSAAESKSRRGNLKKQSVNSFLFKTSNYNYVITANYNYVLSALTKLSAVQVHNTSRL